MSAYLKPKHENINIYNSDDFTYQDEPVTFYEAENRYLKTTGDLVVSCTENTISEGKINGTPASYLEGIVSNVQNQIDEIGTAGEGMFSIYAESKNLNASVNNGHCFSFGSSVLLINDLKINGNCILNKVYIDVKPTIANTRTDGLTVEVWYRPCSETSLLFPDLMNEAIASINISTSQTTGSWYDVTGKSFYSGDILHLIVVSGGNCSSGLLERRCGLLFYTAGIRGKPGSTGERGLQGYVGAKGKIEYTGNTGARGEDGKTGKDSLATNTGSTGYTGYSGNTGCTGNTGATGQHNVIVLSLTTGSTGNTSNTGNTDYTGQPGYASNTGATGNTGDTGYTGNTGCTGGEGRMSAVDLQRLTDLETTIYAGPTVGNNGYPLNYRSLQPFTFMGFINDIYKYADDLNNYQSAARNIADNAFDRSIKLQRTTDSAMTMSISALSVAGTVEVLSLTVGGLVTSNALNQAQIAGVGAGLGGVQAQVGGVEAAVDELEAAVSVMEEEAALIPVLDKIIGADVIVPPLQPPNVPVPRYPTNFIQQGGLIDLSLAKLNLDVESIKSNVNILMGLIGTTETFLFQGFTEKTQEIQVLRETRVIQVTRVIHEIPAILEIRVLQETRVIQETPAILETRVILEIPETQEIQVVPVL